MNEAETHLKELRDAWNRFKTTAHQTSREQRQAFSDLLQEMDAAEIDVVRKNVLEAYDGKS